MSGTKSYMIRTHLRFILPFLEGMFDHLDKTQEKMVTLIRPQKNARNRRVYTIICKVMGHCPESFVNCSLCGHIFRTFNHLWNLISSGIMIFFPKDLGLFLQHYTSFMLIGILPLKLVPCPCWTAPDKESDRPSKSRMI